MKAIVFRALAYSKRMPRAFTYKNKAETQSSFWCDIRKNLATLTIVAIMLSALSGSLLLGTANAATEVSGIITTNTAWTKANSPYTLAGAVAIKEGVTLTIEAGTQVNIGKYYIEVNGTLVARGRSNERITFTSSTHRYGSIAFSSTSSSWNEQTGSGSIIENAVLDFTAISTDRVSPAIIRNEILDLNNYAINIDGGSPIIERNSIEGSIGVHNASPRIANNTMVGGIGGGGNATISNNTIRSGASGSGFGIVCDYATITDNLVADCQKGIAVFYGHAVIERNLVMNNDVGIAIGSDSVIYLDSQGSIATVRHNTIFNNSVGISVEYYPPNPPAPIISNPDILPTITENNVHSNSEYNIYLGSTLNLDAAGNWWGTTEESEISQSIYDSRSDFDLGTVTFKPFLNAPDPEAPPVPSTPPYEPGPFPLVPFAATVIAAVALASIGIFVYLKRRKTEANEA